MVANSSRHKRPPEVAPILGYRRALDGLRAVAILPVMAYHLDSRLMPGGFLGVELFFVLSGFLITALLLEERDRQGGVSIRRFYARRALRLFPALALVLVACAVWALFNPDFLPERGDTLRGIPYVLLYLANWASGAFHVGLGLLDHTWSLAVEEQFYLLWPGLFLLLIRFVNRRTGALICLGAALAVAVARAVGFNLFPGSRSFFYAVTRIDGLLVGCAVALARSVGAFEQISGWVLRSVGAAGAVGIIGAFTLVTASSSAPYLGLLTLVDVAAGALIIGLVQAPDSALARPLSSLPFVAVGRISYGLYLWQTPVTVVLLSYMGSSALGTKVLVIWPAIFLAATASFFFVERPALRLKVRLDPPPTGRETEDVVVGRAAPA